MSTIELRKKLIAKIEKTNDQRLLEEAFRLLDLDVIDEEIFILSESQKTIISNAQQQIKDGLGISQIDADKEINEWLKE